MGGVFLGSFTVGGCVVGLSGAFGSVGSALVSFNNAVATQLSAIESANAIISVQLDSLASINATLGIQNDAILAAKAAIRIPAVAIPEVQVDASADIGIGLTAELTDPALYLSQLLEGLLTVQASLEASLPVVQLTDTINANVQVGLDFAFQIGLIDAQLALLVDINAQVALIISAAATIHAEIAAQVTALLAIQSALTVAISAIASALSTYASMSASLAVPGAFAIAYTGPLSGAGAGIDAVTPSTGLAPSTNVLIPVMLVQQSDTPAVNATNAVYRTS